MGDADIIVDVDQNGNSVVSTPGFRGRSCKDATKELVAALGRTVSENKTQEYYQPDFEPVKKKVKVRSS